MTMLLFLSCVLNAVLVLTLAPNQFKPLGAIPVAASLILALLIIGKEFQDK